MLFEGVPNENVATRLPPFPQIRRESQTMVFDGSRTSQTDGAFRFSCHECNSTEVSAMPVFRRSRRYAMGYIFDQRLSINHSGFSHQSQTQTIPENPVVRRTPRQSSLIDSGQTNSYNTSIGLRSGSLFSEPATHRRYRMGSSGAVTNQLIPKTLKISRSSSRRGALANIFNDAYKRNGLI